MGTATNRVLTCVAYVLASSIPSSGVSNSSDETLCVAAMPQACAYTASSNCGAFVMNSGADIDAWLEADDGKPCSVIGGSLTIQQWNIKAADLQKMLPLVAVCGSVTIQQLATGTLAGLDNLTYIGGAFSLAQNTRPWALGEVHDISALSTLRYVGGAMNVAENYHLTKSDVMAGFRNLSVAGVVNIEFYDNPPSADAPATKTGSVERCTLPALAASAAQCPSACMSCKEGGADDGGVALASDGKCTEHCSMHGYCGTSDVYRIGGTDCSICIAPVMETVVETTVLPRTTTSVAASTTVDPLSFMGTSFSCLVAEPKACAYTASSNCGAFVMNSGADIDAWLEADDGKPCSVIGGSLTIQQWNIKASDLQKMLPLVAVCGSVTIQQLATGTLAGLDNLTYVGGAFFLTQNTRPWASVGEVDDISALSSLRFVGGAMSVVENYHLSNGDIGAGFRNLRVAGAVNIEFYDNPPSAGETATKTGSVDHCTPASLEAPEGACSAACLTCQGGGAADGGVALDSSGKCTEHCSKYGYCGTTDIYLIGGTDCSACKGSGSLPSATAALIQGSFVMTITGASSVLDDPVATAALEKSMAKHIATSLEVDGITVTVALSAADVGDVRRLRRLLDGFRVLYTITVPASATDVSKSSAMAVQEMNAKTSADMTIIANDALQEASAEAPILANAQATGVTIESAAAIEMARDDEDSRESAAHQNRSGLTLALVLAITSVNVAQGVGFTVAFRLPWLWC